MSYPYATLDMIDLIGKNFKAYKGGLTSEKKTKYFAYVCIINDNGITSRRISTIKLHS